MQLGKVLCVLAMVTSFLVKLILAGTYRSNLRSISKCSLNVLKGNIKLTEAK